MQTISRTLRPSLIAVAVASALAIGSTSAMAASSLVKGVVAGAYFTAPVISDNPAIATRSSSVASVYQGAKVCFDLNNNGVCDAGEPFTTSAADGSFTLSSRTAAPLVAEIGTNALNGGHPVTSRNVFRFSQAQLTAVTVNPLLPANVVITPLSTELARVMDADGLSFTAARDSMASRINVSSADLLLAPNKVQDPTELPAILQESVVDAGRFELGAKFVDRGDISPTTAAPIQIKEAQQAAMNLESIPRYDNIFIIILENKATLSIKGNLQAPKINALLAAGNQFVSYFATGNPSEPNYTAIGGGDDFGITDDAAWTCAATGANAVQDPVPAAFAPAGSFTACSTGAAGLVNHNITAHANLFNELTSKGLSWHVYSETQNPGQDPRVDSLANAAIVAPDNLNPTVSVPLPAATYKTKHHPGMAYQNVRSSPEFFDNNRTLGGGQWDASIANYVQAHNTVDVKGRPWVVDQFAADLQTGDVGNYNFLVPDQCDDMHGISSAATDCGSVNNNVPATTVAPIITRGDNYTAKIVQEIQASDLWKNKDKRVAIIVMFDEGNATSGFNSCCGWNPMNGTAAKPLVQNADGSFSVDNSVVNYSNGNRGHGESIFTVLSNQPTAPTGLKDSDYYSHFAFGRTLQDMFGLADPDLDGTYMNRTKYTEKFIAANIMNLPEYAQSADTHFDSVRPMNHAYVFPVNYTQKQSGDVNTPAQTGPDANQINLWSLK